MTVWALFDSETCCVSKALPEHEVYSFGIGGGTEHIHLDLSDFELARKELDRYPRPDVIFASPPCESWVLVSTGSISKYTAEKGYNLFWRNKWNGFDFLPRHKETRLNGVNTAIALAAIIKHCKPQFWAIENGATSWIFDFLKEKCGLDGKRVKTTYYSYGFRYLKPTIICSNALLRLKCIRPRILLQSVCDCDRGDLRRRKKELGIASVKDKALRSAVPPLLYQDIMRQFMRIGQLHCKIT